MPPPRPLLVLALLSAASLAGLASAETLRGPLLGFSEPGTAAERRIESAFDAGLSADEQARWLRQMSSAANQVGAPHDRENAEWMLQQLTSWGWDAHIETFQVLYPTPLHESLELLGDSPFKASLHEPPIPGDASSEKTADVLPPYLAYQGDGDVSAPLVYANYGMPDDYVALAHAGVDVRGKVVITRYGGGWRGLKPLLAQQHGAVGCLIYSDPADDGYGPDDPYPKGGSRPPQGVQRGSVQELTLYPGDPLTPGVGATQDAPRLKREEAATILKIPALPLSYADARPLLEALQGPVAPKPFRGQLPLTYHFGPSRALVHLVVQSDWGLKPVYDVIAVLKGSEAPDQWVVRGNHHDGWVFGAWDPLSGNAAMLDEAKSIGALLKGGWRPKRTLVYASWDGEEPGLLGSTEWAETHAAELQRKAVIYINSDTNARGFLEAEASHDLQSLIDETASEVRDPERPVSVEERARASLQVRALADPHLAKEAKAVAAGAELPLGALGSGSDYSAFLQHLGLATVNLGYGGEDEQAGVYHSLYDDYEHFTRFGDPSLRYGVALSETAGRLALREADAEVLPLRFSGFADVVATYLDELKTLNSERRQQTATQDRLARDNAFVLAADPTRAYRPEDPAAGGAALNFLALEAAAAKLKASAHAYDAALARQEASLTPERRMRLNERLQTIDQTLLDPEGLPGRPWYKNLAYAPGVLTGYGAKTLPGVREAIEGQRWAEAQTYIVKTAKVLEDYAQRVDEAAAILAGG